MSVNLQNALRGSLNILDLYNCYEAASPTLSNKNEPAEIGVKNSEISDETWDIILNGKGIYSITCKLPLPDGANVNIYQADPLPYGKIIVQGTYEIAAGKEKKATLQQWIMIFDRRGKCLMDWKPPLNSSLKTMSTFSDGRFVIMTQRSSAMDAEKPVLHLFNSQGACLLSKPLDVAPIIENMWVLSEDRLALHTSSPGEHNTRNKNSILFLNSQFEVQNQWRFPREDGKCSQIKCFPLPSGELAVTYNEPRVLSFGISNEEQITCYKLTSSREYPNLVQIPRTRTGYDRSESRALREVADGGILLSSYHSNPTQHETIIYSWDGKEHQVHFAEEPTQASFINFPGAAAHQTPCGTVFIKQYGNIQKELGASFQNKPVEVTSDGYTFTYSKNTPKGGCVIHISCDVRNSLNRILPVNFPMLWEALANNRTITECRLQGLPLGDDGASGIAEMLRTNMTMTKLDLTGTGITDKGALALQTALKVNKALTILHLKGNAINPDRMKQIQDRLTQRVRQNRQQPVQSAPAAKVPNIPKECYCSITNCIMFDPVITSEGETHEREAIEARSAKDSANLMLIPNKAIKRQISELFKSNPRLDDQLYYSERLQRECLKAVSKGDLEALKDILLQDPRLLSRPLRISETSSQPLLSYVLEKGSVSLLAEVLKLMRSNSMQKPIAQTKDEEESLFRQAALKFGAEGAQLMGQALGWNTADYEDRLFEAIAKGDLEIVNACAEIVPPDVQDDRGNAPLHIAVLTGHKQLIELFSSHRAAVKAKNAENLTPQQLALKMDRADLARLIEMKRDEGKIPPVLQPFVAQVTQQQRQIEELLRNIQELQRENRELKESVKQAPPDNSAVSSPAGMSESHSSQQKFK